MNIHKLFPSRWVGSADLDGKAVTVTIKAMTIENVGQPPKDEEKPVLWFKGTEKGLILNKTNAMLVASMYGPETDHWMGKKIVLYSTKVKAFGALHDAIRVQATNVVSRQPDPVVEAEPEDVADLDFDMDEVDEMPVDA